MLRIDSCFGSRSGRRAQALKLILATMGTALFALTAAAQNDPLPGIVGSDDREVVDSSAPPWSAVGHINIAGYRMRGICTGTLVSAGVVVTAAHCVIDPFTKKPHAAKDIHFLAGVNKDRSIGHSVASCVKFPDNFKYVGPQKILPDLNVQTVTLESLFKDVAVIVLAQPIPKAGTMQVAAPDALKPGEAVIHAAYPAERRYVLNADKGCKMISAGQGLVETSCDSSPGSSGGPLLVNDSGTMKIAGVLVSSAYKDKATLAVALSEWPNMPLDTTCP